MAQPVETRHGYEAQHHEAEAKPKLYLNYEAEAEAKAEALAFLKHEAEAEAEALTFWKHEAEAEAEAQMLQTIAKLLWSLFSMFINRVYIKAKIVWKL